MSKERVEVSIFKELDYSKNLISSVMRPEIEGGVGQMMFGILPALESSFSDSVFYHGKIRSTAASSLPPPPPPPPHAPHQHQHVDSRLVYGPEPPGGYPQSEEDRCMIVSARFALFGGSAYHVHKENDSGKFSHVLPGVHDVDANAFIVCDSSHPSFEMPFSRSSVDRLKKQMDILDGEDSPISFILSRIVSVIRDQTLEGANSGDFVDEYDLLVDGSTNRVVLETPGLPEDGDDSLVYAEVVGDLFRVKVVDGVQILIVQVDVNARDTTRNVSFVDHVFELIIPFGNPRPPSEMFERIRGIEVETKEVLFANTMSALLNRSIESLCLSGEEPCDGKRLQGKCAQDFLRLVYLLLTEMGTSGNGWSTRPVDFRRFRLQQGGPIMGEALMRLGLGATPLKLFMFVSRFVRVCVQASTFSDMEIDESSIDRDFARILSVFREAFRADDTETFVSGDEIKRILEEARREQERFMRLHTST